MNSSKYFTIQYSKKESIDLDESRSTNESVSISLLYHVEEQWWLCISAAKPGAALMYSMFTGQCVNTSLHILWNEESSVSASVDL